MYISQDPIGLEGGNQFYQYVFDPLSCIDPVGLSKKFAELIDQFGNVVSTGKSGTLDIDSINGTIQNFV